MINLFLVILTITGESFAGKFDGLDISTPKRKITIAFSKFSSLYEEVERREKRPHILFFTASWCGPCQNIKASQKWAEESGWKFGVDGHIEYVDIDEHPEIFAKYNGGNNSVPLIVNPSTKDTKNPGSMLDVLNFYTQGKKRE